MDKRFTNEEVVRAAHCCTKNDCKTCPFIILGAGFKNCVIKFSEYIANNTKSEPAPAATGTSSEVSVKEDTDNIQFNGSTKEQICQAYDTADKACADILDIYEGMPACERRAFDIGEAYGQIFSTRDKLEKLRGGDSK